MATIFLPQVIIGLGNGLLLPTAIAGAVSIRPQAAGTASGMTGFTQMAIGAAAAQISGHIIAGASDAMPMLLLMLFFGIATGGRVRAGAAPLMAIGNFNPGVGVVSASIYRDEATPC